jgi:DNA-binding NtrC family response regulator/predicted hydrocarbon binding protein
MRADDLDHKELLELDAESGFIRFAGQRAILLDTIAMGQLRKYLVENFGLLAARTVLTQCGFAQGWRMAEAMKAEFKWDNYEQWRHAGTRIHTLQGLFRMEAGSLDPLSLEGMVVTSSYEAEQHLLHFGQADAPICWTISGLISGYLTRSSGEEIFVLEDRCVGNGHATCHLIGRTRNAWGDERAEELQFFETKPPKGCLDLSFQRVPESLNVADGKLKEYRQALVKGVPEKPELLLGIVATSEAMRKLVDLARRAAKVDCTVLITGESGSGKERFARLVHHESSRATGPFVAINCGAITDSLIESELFGHARGSFTDATTDRLGLFEAANQGTLFLDEIGHLALGMQVKLLRALQEREIRRVGENKTRKVDVRIIAATNCDLAQEVTRGAFRQDLYYRLKVVELKVPALKERREDILPLAHVLLAGSALKMNRNLSGISPSAAEQLLRYGWPGNVRELENAMERAVALSQGNRVEREDLPEEVRQAAPKAVAVVDRIQSLQEVEREHILSVLNLNGGNQTQASKQLKIGPATLYRKLKSYGLLPGYSA